MKKLIVAFVFLFAALPCKGRAITVDSNGSADFDNIQAAIDDSNHHDTITVAADRYYENINFGGKNIVLRSTDPNDPDIVANCIIDGNGLGPVVTFVGTESPDCILSGFTITGGYAARGGGIYGGEPSRPGAIGTQARIEHNIIMLNTSTGSGGGIANCDGIIRHNIVTQNTAAGAGGGIWHCDGLIQDNIVSNNHSGGQGGGLCGCFGTIRNNVISGNSTVNWGGGINKSLDPNCMIENNTICGNSADYGGGLCDCGKATIRNCIVVGNRASAAGSQLHDFDPPYADPRFSCIQNWAGGIGNIDTDPCFVNADNSDYHLQSEAGRWDPNQNQWVIDSNTSLCIDAGNPGSPLADEPKQVNNIRINMGAYGGTAQASKTPANWSLLADLTNDGTVDFVDFGHFAAIFSKQDGHDFDRDGDADYADLHLLTEDWLKETIWHK